MEGRDLRIIQHPSHDHSWVLRESLLGDDRYGGQQVYCDGCRAPISSTFFSSRSCSSGAEGGGGHFYACPNSDCWFLMHKRCAELPPEIEHPCHAEHALTLDFFEFRGQECDVCHSTIDSFLYFCFGCKFYVHVRCASMMLHIQDRVDENHKIHQHPLIPLEEEAQFVCYACGREHKGKSYLCTTCGFWANQICASAPTTVNIRRHPHPLSLFRSLPFEYHWCKICNEKFKRAYWGYSCSEECWDYWVHVSCWLSLEEAENSNKDIQTNLHSESTDPKEEIKQITWPMSDDSIPIMTQLIKNLSLQGTQETATKILYNKEGHQLKFVEKIEEFKDDRECDCCGQTISSQFFHCAHCNFSLHEWCAKLPDKLSHILHSEHLLHLSRQSEEFFRPKCCVGCLMPANTFMFGCLTCGFYLDLKCASLPRLIKHQAHGHNLALRRMRYFDSCTACGKVPLTYFGLLGFLCEACNFKVCITCALLPFSVRHRYDKHPFSLTYSSIKGQLNDYYCEICEEDIDTVYWFYHCIKCDQSLHPNCIYPFEQFMNVKLGARVKVNFHSHLLSYVPTKVNTHCHVCHTGFRRSGFRRARAEYVALECNQCNLLMHLTCAFNEETDWIRDYGATV